MYHVWISGVSVTGSGPNATVSVSWGAIYPGSIELQGPTPGVAICFGTSGTAIFENRQAGKYKARAICNSPGHTDGAGPWLEFTVP